MMEALKGALGSKKALAAMGGTVASTLVTMAGKYGVLLDPAGAEKLVMVILGIVAAYVLGQGVADWGKEAAKVQAAAAEAIIAKEGSLWATEEDDLDADDEPEVLTEA
jgi:hypothetical protein